MYGVKIKNCSLKHWEFYEKKKTKLDYLNVHGRYSESTLCIVENHYIIENKFEKSETRKQFIYIFVPFDRFVFVKLKI